MSTTTTVGVPPVAERVADRLPARDGRVWTAAPYPAWWTARPAARLTDGHRALILAPGTWDTDVAWQTPDREPYAPDVTLRHLVADRIAREALRLVLPVLDDHTAGHGPVRPARADQLTDLDTALRAHGAHTRHQVGILPRSNVLSWSWHGGGVRFAATLTGDNPLADLDVHAPRNVLERVLPLFCALPALDAEPPRLDGVRGTWARRIARHLGAVADVEQLDCGGLSIGRATGPYGYIAPPQDAGDSTTVALHGIGVDYLISLAPHLTR